MRKLLLTSVASATVLMSMSWSIASAHEGPPWEPGRYARMGLKYGHAKQIYNEGCAVWNWQQQSWYNKCVNGTRDAAPVAVKY